MKNSKKDYYNQEIFWENDLYSIPREKIRIDEIIRNIPEDVITILDIGCGNGAVLNKLLESSKYERLVGIDFSETALKYVKTEKYLMNIENLIFKDKSFDLVICNEVLEHLPYQEYNSALKEITRVAKKYILVTTPNQEDLESNLVCCPECNAWFNQEYHVRSFNKDKLFKLFESFECKIISEIGDEIPRIKHNSITRLFNIYYIKRTPSNYSKCPQCEMIMSDYNKFKSDDNKSFIQKFLIKLSLIFTNKEYHKLWLLALYERKRNS